MMTCQEVTEFLLDQDMGDLPPELARLVQDHQAVCPPCSAFARTYQAVPGMVHDALQAQVSEELQAELDSAVLEAIRKSA